MRIVEDRIYTLHISTLLELIGAPQGEGTLIVQGGGESIELELDLEDLCLQVSLQPDPDDAQAFFDRHADKMRAMLANCYPAADAESAMRQALADLQAGAPPLDDGRLRAWLFSRAARAAFDGPPDGPLPSAAAA